jgi:peptidoglycan hydrolase-like protein with peptidoglycan-binding domain
MSLNSAENTVNERPPIPGGPAETFVTIPDNITVHLGLPDEEAENVTVPFIDYIKNVASSELYPTWPEEAIRANIHAIVSFALNRVFVQWYRSKGYDFDITNSASYDMAYVEGRGIFDNISNIADEIFNQYIINNNEIVPFFAAFCDGRISQCSGMYQWGSVDLAGQGYTALEILKYYYGENISIVKGAPVRSESTLTYPGEPIKLGDSSILVLVHQLGINRIARNYPAIPIIDPVNGYFGESTENAVKEFQKIFNLPVTGVIDQATFYKMRYIYLAITKVSEITAERSILNEVLESTKYISLEGDVRPRVTIIQYFLTVLSSYYDTIPEVQITGTFDPQTRVGVIEFQKAMGLPATGIVDKKTWDTMYNTILGILDTLPAEAVYLPYIRPHGIVYRLGMGIEYPAILFIQEMLSFISQSTPQIPRIHANGIYDEATEIAVKAFQSTFGLEPTGVVDDKTWDLLNNVYRQKRYGTEAPFRTAELK